MIDCLEHWFSAHENEAVEIAKKIFSHPETAYEEIYASQVLREYLASNGFEISEIDGLPTAFRASYGQGGPVIGILAEYDALPGMGQAPVSHYEPVDGPGHGCGHNLIAGCSAAAAAALKHYLETEHMAGTVILFGCPAEENNPTKGYMISKGVFDNVDAAFSFHGGNFNTISNFSLQAMDIADFAFSGKTAHAALNPDEGRSASDAVEIMCVGLQYLREHVKDGTRIHYQHLVMEQAPNVVSDYAKIKVVCRADSRTYCQDVLRRIVQVAEGAAMITETKASHQRKGSWYDTVVNHTLNRILYDAAQEIPMPEYTEEEEQFAKRVYENTTGKAAGQSAMCKTMAPLSDKVLHTSGSTDVCEVSYKLPTALVMTACQPVEMPGHHWNFTACSGSSIGFKGMLYGAKIIAAGAARIFADPRLAEAVREEFEAAMESRHYEQLNYLNE